MEDNQILQIKEEDNAAVALSPLASGSVLNFKGRKINVCNDIPRGHKVALEKIKKGSKVIKYGYPIGKAVEEISRGEWIHTHNLKTALQGKKEYRYNAEKGKGSIVPVQNKKIPAFKGYRRADGSTGIRNEIWIINTVGCINKPVEKMASTAANIFNREIDSGIIDGIFSFPHPYGCSQLGDDLKNTQKILAGLVRHPNAAGVLVVGLGCENNKLEDFKKIIGQNNGERVKFLELQQVEDGQEIALQKIEQLINYARKFKPEKIPVSKLKIGLKCGGSDSFSGITANPLLGRISDKLITYGGTTILTEVPEMFGAETILMNRAKDEKVFRKIVDLINDFKDYFLTHGQTIYENPSPGNIEGGITTLEEKSLGNIEKGGRGQIMGVNDYGAHVSGNGLQLLSGPGNDLVSTTALTAAGAQMVLFTTGRGTPFGCPVPTVKISTNSQLYKQKKNWIDFDAGQLLAGKAMEELTDDFFSYLMEVASGQQKTKNELNDYREIAIFKTGVTL